MTTRKMPDDAWLETATIGQLQGAMTAGRFTSEALVLAYLDRITRYDRQGVTLNAVLEINPDALHIAQALDAERARTGVRGPLHGIPVLIKDNIDTGDKMHTSAGSLALAESYAPEDSFVAGRLREAGAVLLGKTNLTEWANFMADNMPNGYSSRGGQVLNPYGPGQLDVGGSSSGSGAAVAASLAAAAVGTETSGSILSPASQNSIVGIKPTVGLISRSGIIPIAHSQDTAGPMARTVADAAVLLGALAGVDERDWVTSTATGRHAFDYTSVLDKDGLRGARIGVPRDPYFLRLDERQQTIMDSVISVLRELGAIVIDPVTIPTAQELHGYEVLVYEFKPNLNAYLQRLSARVPVHSLRELIAFNTTNAETALRYGQAVLLQSEATTGTLTEPAYLQARRSDLQGAQEGGIDAAMAEHHLDALLFPANWGAGIAAKAGYPSVTVPAGYGADGAPLGATFTGQAFSEPTLIRLAYAFEQATLHRRSPRLSE